MTDDSFSIIDAELIEGDSPTASASEFAAITVSSLRPPDPALHATFLGLSGMTLLLAVVLSVRNGVQVDLPWFNWTVPELCFWKSRLGIGCPGCGLTRCFVSMARCDIVSAARYNIVGIPLFLVVVAQLPYRTVQMLRISRGKKEIDGSRFAPWLVVFPILLLAQWIVRLCVGTDW